MLEDIPQRLKPRACLRFGGTTEVVPFQNIVVGNLSVAKAALVFAFWRHD
jgi:hypothetical protein